jgi:hypothetical protein
LSDGISSSDLKGHSMNTDHGHHGDVNLVHLDRWIDLCIAEGWGGFEATAQQARDEIQRARKMRAEQEQQQEALLDDLWTRTISVLAGLSLDARARQRLEDDLRVQWQIAETTLKTGEPAA